MKKEGFTLLEVIVVLIIIGIVLAIFIPRYVDRGQRLKEQESNKAVNDMYYDDETTNKTTTVEAIAKTTSNKHYYELKAHCINGYDYIIAVKDNAIGIVQTVDNNGDGIKCYKD